MRKIIVSEYISLDGVVEEPKWMLPFRCDDGRQFVKAQLFAADALLLGRKTYQEFAQAWPTMQDADGFADRMNALPKYVVSRTLTAVTWNASLLQGNLTQTIAKLKQEPGQDLLVCGSGELVVTLLQQGLVDELRLLVCPVTLGQGKRLFPDGLQLTGTLLQATPLSSGAIILSYGMTNPNQNQ